MNLKQKLGIVLFLVIPCESIAQTTEISFNGFASVFGGKAIKTEKNPNAVPCACYVADYPSAGFYTNEWSFDADTSYGLQANAKISDKLSVTGQFVGHGSQDYTATMEWAYVTYKLNDQWSLQGGRKRLPLFYYSDYFDVGFALPWIRASGDSYGWQITGYDGVNAQYTSNWGDINVIGNIFTGRDDSKNNTELSTIYYASPDGPVQVDETWKAMTGGYIDLTWEWLNFRSVYMQNKVDRLVHDSTPPRVRLKDVKQNFKGVSANIDWKNISVRSEYNMFKRPSEENTYYAKLLGIGYQMGNWLPMITRTDFREKAGQWSDIEIHHTTSFSLRWDFTRSAALKLQYDDFVDESKYFYYGNDNISDFVGDSKTIALGIDVVF